MIHTLCENIYINPGKLIHWHHKNSTHTYTLSEAKLVAIGFPYLATLTSANLQKEATDMKNLAADQLLYIRGNRDNDLFGCFFNTLVTLSILF